MPSLVPGSASRPADVFLPTWERGQPAALDVTVASTLQNRTVAGAASVSGYAISVARERRWLHTQRPASQWEFHLSLWWSKHWGVGMKRRFVQSLPSVVRRVDTWEFHHQTLHDTCSSTYGGETPACGSVALHCILLQLTDRADFSVFVFVFLCLFVFVFLCLFVYIYIYFFFCLGVSLFCFYFKN